MLVEESSAKIIYRSDLVHPCQANSQVFDILDFVAEVSAHFPEVQEKTMLFSSGRQHPGGVEVA